MIKRAKSVPKPRTPSRKDDPLALLEPVRPTGVDALVSSRGPFPIVGIGASAGGLKAFEAFFSAMPTDPEPGMAFVLVQHLAPDHRSLLAELVQRFTRMQVFEITDGMVVKPNCVYIIPASRDLALLNGALQLLEQAMPHGQRLPIDFFFRSLAQDQHERAIGIVLSGTGSDGTLGLRAIKGEGGMIMVQDPDSAEYDGMPRSALAAGLVDYGLPLAEMPGQLISYVTRLFGRFPLLAAGPVSETEDALKKIFILLRAETGHNFSQYKSSTVLRRIERRMAVHRIDNVEDYARYLRKHPEEVEALFQDLLIGVTHFFRDPEAFDALQQLIIPKLFEGKAPGAPIRIWVPGCSTGEEAYSIAILVQEQLEKMSQPFNVRIFATDIDGRAIVQARRGLYPCSIAADISPDRLARFFVPEPDGLAYRIHARLRDLLVFSEQDVIRDPPFSRLDLISCRNLMIYLDRELQNRLIAMFHYALTPDGRLFLGSSESLGEFHKFFSDTDHKAMLYQRKAEAPGKGPGKNLPFQEHISNRPRAFNPPAKAGSLSLRELTERTILQHFAPVGVLTNEHGDILYLQGRTGRYLEPAPGESSMNILKMAREGLRLELVTALHRAVLSKEAVQLRDLRVKTDGGCITVDMMVYPVNTGPGAAIEWRYLVILEGRPDPQLVAAQSGEGTKDAGSLFDARLANMAQALKLKEEYLQTANEKLETSNEELQSMNEELQSTNEEMETSKEELQSVNEELATVNAELQQKVVDLSKANNDMSNFLAGTGVGTVFVDHRLRIQRFTPAATQVINLIPTDLGRPLVHIASNLVDYDRLVPDIQAVLDTLVPRECEVRSQGDLWYLLRIRPYRTLENVIEGAVITFTEITELKLAQVGAARELKSARHLATVVRDSHDAVMLLGMDGRILAWNPGAERSYGWSETEALGMNIRDMVPEEGREQALLDLHRLSLAEVLSPCRAQRKAKNGQLLEVWLTATALLSETGRVYAISTTERARAPQSRTMPETRHGEEAQP